MQNFGTWKFRFRIYLDLWKFWKKIGFEFCSFRFLDKVSKLNEFGNNWLKIIS